MSSQRPRLEREAEPEAGDDGVESDAPHHRAQVKDAIPDIRKDVQQVISKKSSSGLMLRKFSSERKRANPPFNNSESAMKRARIGLPILGSGKPPRSLATSLD